MSRKKEIAYLLELISNKSVPILQIFVALIFVGSKIEKLSCQENCSMKATVLLRNSITIRIFCICQFDNTILISLDCFQPTKFLLKVFDGKLKVRLTLSK